MGAASPCQLVDGVLCSLRYVVHYNVIVVLSHPLAELFRSMHRPNIDLPQCFLGWRKVEKGVFADKVWRENVVNETVHGYHV